MSIVNTLRAYLAEYDGLEMVLTDITRGIGSSALSQSAGGTVKRDILGNATYQNSYLFQMKEHGMDEVDRQDNYDFLEAFCEWLVERNEKGDLPKLQQPYTAVSLEVSNVMLMDIEGNGAATYQVQIQFVYKKNNEVKNPWLN